MNPDEKKVFQIGNVVRFKDYQGEKVGLIVAVRADHPDTYLVVWKEPQEKWVQSENLEVDTIETLKRYEETNEKLR